MLSCFSIHSFVYIHYSNKYDWLKSSPPFHPPRQTLWPLKLLKPIYILYVAKTLYLHIVSIILHCHHGVRNHTSLFCVVTASTLSKLADSCVWVCLYPCVCNLCDPKWFCHIATSASPCSRVFRLWVRPAALTSKWWLCCQSDIKEAYFSQQYARLSLYLAPIYHRNISPRLKAHFLYFKPSLDLTVLMCTLISWGIHNINSKD